MNLMPHTKSARHLGADLGVPARRNAQQARNLMIIGVLPSVITEVFRACRAIMPV
jgi:hypothetical protein